MALAAAVYGAVAAAAATGNMNGKYSVTTVDKVNAPFNDDYASKGHEYFDVWSPEIATTYGENFWTSVGNHPLPADIIERFKGKVMAITGYEQDQVLVDPVGQPGVHPERDISVPINWAYNHHYMAWMTGQHSRLVTVEAEPGDTTAHGAATKQVAQDLPSAAFRNFPEAPTSQMFSEGNGGESRKSFHGYPNGYAQLIESPTTWTITPMQIDTRRRDCGVTRDSIHNCTKFSPWMEPKQARYGRHVTESLYSGVLECPCNSRYGGDPIFYPDAQTKVTERSYAALAGGTCKQGERIDEATLCWEAARSIGLNATRLVNATIADKTLPAGCFVRALPDGVLAATVNSAGDSAPDCPDGGVRSGEATSLVNVTLGIHLDPAPSGGVATITLSGPAGAWFGAGLDATHMADSPYTIVANASGVFEQQIGTCGSEAEHCPGSRLAVQSLTLVSNTVLNGRRTVVATRPFKGASSHHYTFDIATLGTLNFITAIGQTQLFAYHKAHHAAVVSLLAPAGQPTCLCNTGTTHYLCENGGVHCMKFRKNCAAPWDGTPTGTGGELLEPQHNPTCNGFQYAGGLTCCGHKRIMLDADQDPGPSLLRYHMKMRFWFQEYSPGTRTPGDYALRPGTLPKGNDARSAGTMTVESALAACTALASGCVGISFQSDDSKAHGKPVLVYFKNGTDVPNGQPDWQSWVVGRKGQSHHDLPRFYYQTEAWAGEYDIPPAFRRAADPPIPGYPAIPVSTSPADLHLTPGTTCTGDCPNGDSCSCEHQITYHWTMSNAAMLYAGGHCHAPSCISIELYRNDSGVPQLLCRQVSTYGQGHVSDDRFDEAGYITLPPCLWGTKDEGLAPLTWLPPNTPMFSIKKNRNTHAGHFGEMASWQMRGVNIPP